MESRYTSRGVRTVREGARAKPLMKVGMACLCLFHKIKIILDNHSSHNSKETRGYLATKQNRFEFIFTPTHASWLNIIETFFSKLVTTMFRDIRVKNKEELKQWILQHIERLNEAPVIFRWKYKMDTIEPLTK